MTHELPNLESRRHCGNLLINDFKCVFGRGLVMEVPSCLCMCKHPKTAQSLSDGTRVVVGQSERERSELTVLCGLLSVYVWARPLIRGQARMLATDFFKLRIVPPLLQILQEQTEAKTETRVEQNNEKRETEKAERRRKKGGNGENRKEREKRRQRKTRQPNAIRSAVPLPRERCNLKKVST